MLLRPLAVTLLLAVGIARPAAAQVPASQPAAYDAQAADGHARMALACVHKEYPNKIAHVLNGPADVAAPSELTPSFYGCFDWHSAVHGHWLLVRVLRRFPEVACAAELREALTTSLTHERLAAELAYLQAPGRATFERPYGLAWLLQLAAELRAWDDPLGRATAAAIAPLERECAARLRAWLPKLSHPIRTGEHSQSAFAMGLIRDWAVVAGDDEMRRLVDERTRAFHADDRDWPMRFEPSGQDFLSPGLAVADLVRRVLPPAEFAPWLGGYLPKIPLDGGTDWLPVAVVTDRTDGKLAHLDGLNLSRAWMLDGIAAALDADDARRPALLACARAHRQAGLRAVLDAPYEGSHWLGTFAVYLATERGLAPSR